MNRQRRDRLEQHRLVIRRDHHEIPPRVEYDLTALGQSLAKAISVLDEWVIRNYHLTTDDQSSKQRIRSEHRQGSLRRN